MANRRMFSKTITNSSNFLMMPLSSQALYMHLGMNADDDGYVEYFGVMRMCGANADDLKVLASKNFIRVFDDYVLIIKDWTENNYIQSDRYHPSKYLNVYKMDTEVRLGKVRLGKEEKEKETNKEKEKNLRDFSECKRMLIDKMGGI